MQRLTFRDKRFEACSSFQILRNNSEGSPQTQLLLHREKQIVAFCVRREETGHITAKLLLGQEIREEELTMYTSKIHKAVVDLKHWRDFLQQKTQPVINWLRLDLLVLQFQPQLEQVAAGLDIWVQINPVARPHWQEVLNYFGAEPSSQQNQERLVKLTTNHHKLHWKDRAMCKCNGDGLQWICWPL